MTDGQGTGAFQEILILGAGRSGSNLLCSLLRNLRGNARFFEVFARHAVEGLQDFPDLQAALGEHYALEATNPQDPALQAVRDSDPVRFFDFMSAHCKAAGHASFSCKIFPNQISPDDLSRILARPGLGVILLTRSRIARYISTVKGALTRQYVLMDTTDLRPDLRLEDFLVDAFEIDQSLDQMRDIVTASGVPTALLQYERDLDIEPDLRMDRVRQALTALGVTPDFMGTDTESWMVKQDHSAFWADRISNGFEIAAALAGLGLGDYATDAPLLDHVPPAEARRRSAPSIPAVVAIPARRDELLAEGGYNRAFSADPVITFTAIQYDRSFMAEWMIGPEPAFGSRKGMHFLKPTWSMEESDMAQLRESIALAQRCNPGHSFVFMHVSDREEQRYRSYGLPSVPGNPNLFVDEAVLDFDGLPHPAVPESDAIYIARLEPWKSHDLAKDLTAPLFVYANPETPESQAHMTLLRETCPSAHFVNHMLGEGSYRYVQRADLARVMARARVSLALSAIEGCMRASSECLLAGLPVVTVPSIGAREVFYTPDTALMVEPSPEAVRAGVEEMIARRLTRAEVRSATLQRLREERYRFVAAANRIVQSAFGPLAPEITMPPLLDFTIRYVTLGSMIEKLK